MYTPLLQSLKTYHYFKGKNFTEIKVYDSLKWRISNHKTVWFLLQGKRISEEGNNFFVDLNGLLILLVLLLIVLILADG